MNFSAYSSILKRRFNFSFRRFISTERRYSKRVSSKEFTTEEVGFVGFVGGIIGGGKSEFCHSSLL